jgi:hypothetical protein
VDFGCNRSDPVDSLEASWPGLRPQNLRRIACKRRLELSSAYGGRLFAQQHSQHDRRRIFRKAAQRFASRWPLRLLRGVVIRPKLMIVAHDAILVRVPMELCISRFDLASRQPLRQQTRRLRIDLPTEGGCPKWLFNERAGFPVGRTWLVLFRLVWNAIAQERSSQAENRGDREPVAG